MTWKIFLTGLLLCVVAVPCPADLFTFTSENLPGSADFRPVGIDLYATFPTISTYDGNPADTLTAVSLEIASLPPWTTRHMALGFEETDYQIGPNRPNQFFIPSQARNAPDGTGYGIHAPGDIFPTGNGGLVNAPHVWYSLKFPFTNLPESFGDMKLLNISFDYGISRKKTHVSVPEPGTLVLLGTGLVGLAGWGRKRFRK